MAAGRTALSGAGAETAKQLVERLITVVGRRHILTRQVAMRRFMRGYRYGEGTATAVALPATLLELWRVLQTCAQAGAAVIAQASVQRALCSSAGTGLPHSEH
jgi:hypothetical protein